MLSVTVSLVHFFIVTLYAIKIGCQEAVCSVEDR